MLAWARTGAASTRLSWMMAGLAMLGKRFAARSPMYPAVHHTCGHGLHWQGSSGTAQTERAAGQSSRHAGGGRAPPTRKPTAAPAVVNCTMIPVAVFEKPSNCGTAHAAVRTQQIVPMHI